MVIFSLFVTVVIQDSMATHRINPLRRLIVSKSGILYPATVLELLDELEAAKKRIAELEAREILLPERSSMLHRTDFHDDYQTVMAYKVSEVIDAIRATGIRIKGE